MSDRSDQSSELFRSRGAEPTIPKLNSVPETREEKRARRTIRIAAASFVALCLVVLGFALATYAGAKRLRDAVTRAAATGTAEAHEAALSLLDATDAESLALRARLLAAFAIDRDASALEAAEAALAQVPPSRVADRVVAELYMALARGDAASAAALGRSLEPAGPYAAEIAHAKALAAFVVGEEVAGEMSAAALRPDERAPRHAALRARVLGAAGSADEAARALGSIKEATPEVEAARAELAGRRGDWSGVAAAASAAEAHDPRAADRMSIELARAERGIAMRTLPAAREALARARATRPNFDMLLALRAARIAMWLGDVAVAADELGRVPPLDGPHGAERAFLSARVALARGDVEAAKSALDGSPDLAEGALLRGRIELAQRHFDRAEPLLARARGEASLELEALTALSAVARARGRHDDAIELADLAVGKDATDVDAVLAAVEARLAANRELRRAAAIADSAIDAGMNDPRVLAARAEVAFAAERVAEARPLLERATAVSSASALMWSRLGDACRMLGDQEAARAAYDRALALEPTQPIALVGALDVANDALDVPRVEVLLERVSALERDDARTLLLVAEAHVVAAHGAAGIRDARRSVDESPDDLASWLALGRLYLQAEQLGSAIAAFQRVEQLDADHPFALLGRARVQARSGQSDPAMKTLLEAEREARKRRFGAIFSAERLAIEARLRADELPAAARRLAQRALEADEKNAEANLVLADVEAARENDPSDLLRRSLGGRVPLPEAHGRLALTATDEAHRCDHARRYLAAVPRGLIRREVEAVAGRCPTR